MKQESFFEEALLIVQYSEVNHSWYTIIQEFTKLSLQDRNTDIKFYNQLIKFSSLISLLATQFPLFFEFTEKEQLKKHFSVVDSYQTVSSDVLFLWENLFKYLLSFSHDNSNYNIELNDISDVIDNLIYLLAVDLNVD